MTQQINYIKIKDFKGLKELEVGNLNRFVAIFGENGAGKTSFIEAIKNSIRAGKGVNSKVRKGAKSGEIIVEFDDFIITRIVGQNGSLKVEHNGELVKSPQKWLDNIFKGSIGDPQKFLNLTKADKVRYLLETQGKGEEFEKLEMKRQINYQDRQDKHRTYLAKREEIEKTEKIEEDFEEPTGNIEQWEKELQEINNHNNEKYLIQSRIDKGDTIINQKDNNVDQTKQSIYNSEVKIEEYKRLIIKEEERLKILNDNLLNESEELSKAKKLKSDLEEELKCFVERDTDELMEKISLHNSMKDKMAEIKARKSLLEDQKKKESELLSVYKELDEIVKNIEQEQNDLIKELKMGYEMKVEDGVMSIKVGEEWIALDELNKALQIEIGVDICLNGPNEIKIITIEDANSLDPQTLNRIKEKIDDKNAQCFLETVYNTGYESIIIKDGEQEQKQK